MKILLFMSSHCPHCPGAETVARKVAPEYYKHGVELKKIRMKTSDGKQLSRQFNIMSTPTILMLDNNETEIQRIVGEQSESSLKNKIEEGLGLKKSLFSKILGR